MNSVLPDHLEQKRLIIARANNRRVIRVLVVLGVTLLGVALMLRDLPKEQRFPILLTILGVAFVLEVYILRNGWKENEEMCRSLGFMCPHCGGTLYEPRSFISINGLCPKCRKPVIAI